jgi:hypothetical protein
LDRRGSYCWLADEVEAISWTGDGDGDDTKVSSPLSERPSSESGLEVRPSGKPGAPRAEDVALGPVVEGWFVKRVVRGIRNGSGLGSEGVDEVV